MNYCDNCGAPGAYMFVSELPVAVESANAGESATLCGECYASLVDEDPTAGFIYPTDR